MEIIAARVNARPRAPALFEVYSGGGPNYAPAHAAAGKKAVNQGFIQNSRADAGGR